MMTLCLKSAKLKVLPKVLVLIIGNTFVGEYWYWYCQYFLLQVLILVLAIPFASIANNPALNQIKSKTIKTHALHMLSKHTYAVYF